MTFRAAGIGAVFAAVLILSVSGGQVEKMTYGDGRFSLYVAEHLDDGPGDLDPIVAARGPSARYGRIGQPVVVWLLSFGQPQAMPYVQPALMVVSAGLISSGTFVLLRTLGLRIALLPFLAIGVSISLSGGYVEGLASAATVWTIVFAQRQRWLPAAAVLGVAMLSRETAVLVAVGLVAWTLWRKQFRGAAIVSLSIIPVLVWHGLVASRFGHWPLADPYFVSGAELRTIPFISIFSAIIDRGWSARLIALVHMSLAGIAFARWRISPIDAAAAGAALQVVMLPDLTWRYPGDAFRTFAFLELLTITALAAAVARMRQGDLPEATART